VVLDGLSMEGDTIVLEHEGQRLEFEYMIAGTGYRIDIALKPELAAAAPHVKLWRHAIGPEAASVSPDWAAFPYLGGGFQFRQAELGAAPWVENIHAYNYAAMLSHGVHVGDVASAVIGVPRLVQGIAADFYAENPLACISRSPLYLD
jgi:cation diffusion facilitator CzcD-associated flavoprotein CzcO